MQYECREQEALIPCPALMKFAFFIQTKHQEHNRLLHLRLHLHLHSA